MKENEIGELEKFIKEHDYKKEPKEIYFREVVDKNREYE